MKACFACSKNNLIKSWTLLKLSTKYFIYSIKCLFHNNTNTTKQTLCTRLSTSANNIYGCSPQITLFNIENILPIEIIKQSKNDTALLEEINQIQYLLKKQQCSPIRKTKQIRLLKWMKELYYYRQIEDKRIRNERFN